MPTTTDTPLVTIPAVPPAFVTDCLESDCDVGDYDARKRTLTANPEQLAELVSRADHYANDGCDCSFGLKRSAVATLKAIARVSA
jgi:hypothetical protein